MRHDITPNRAHTEFNFDLNSDYMTLIILEYDTSNFCKTFYSVSFAKERIPCNHYLQVNSDQTPTFKLKK